MNKKQARRQKKPKNWLKYRHESLEEAEFRIQSECLRQGTSMIEAKETAKKRAPIERRK